MFTSFFKAFIYLFLEIWKGGRKRGRETFINCVLHAPQLGTGPSMKACILTGNQTGDLSLSGMTLNQVSHTSQGHVYFFGFPNITGIQFKILMRPEFG